jgi:hypothetical protein
VWWDHRVSASLPTWVRAVAALAALSAAGACRREALVAPVAPVALVAPGARPASAGDATRSPTQGLSRDELIAMFTESCRARPWVLVFDLNGVRESPLCEAEPFQQSCSPDHFGCWPEYGACRAECGQRCGACDLACDGACDACRADCQGAPGCAARCAEARTRCFEGCGAALDACRDEACVASMTACESAGEKEKRAVCGPDCEAHSRCLMGEGATAEGCRARFPALDARCFGWCLPI